MRTENKSVQNLRDEKDYVRFWSKVNLTANDDLCWDWMRCKNKKGYGVFGIGQSVNQAHRVAYVNAYGIDPKDLNVLHKCDNPSCVNPKHLFLGTNLDNVADKVAKKRASCLKGEINPKAKLMDFDIPKIRELYSNGMKYKEIADLYHVSRCTIGQIIRKEIWKHT